MNHNGPDLSTRARKAGAFGAPDSSRILAVDPGTRYMGIAVFDQTHLIRHGVKVVRSRGVPSHEALRRATEIITRILDRYRPGVLVLEKTFFAGSRRSAILNVLVQDLRRLARERGLQVREYAPSTVRKLLCRDGRAAKLEVARLIATDHYPWLRPYYERDLGRPWFKEKYWLNMFDAVALGLAYRRVHGGADEDREAA
jgi:Holliday junction resolvasome RuvABC endonuclease subunit